MSHILLASLERKNVSVLRNQFSNCLLKTTIGISNGGHAISLNGLASGESLTVNNAGLITTGNAISAGSGTITLNASTAAGSDAITLSKNISAGSLTLNVALGNITESGGSISSGLLSVGLLDATSADNQIATFSSASNNVAALTGTGGANAISLNNGGQALAVNTFAAGQSLTVSNAGVITIAQAMSGLNLLSLTGSAVAGDAIHVTVPISANSILLAASSGTITVDSGITVAATNDLTVQTTGLNSSGTLHGNTVNVASPVGQPLTIQGTAGKISSSFNVVAASSGSLTFLNGSQILNGFTFLNAPVSVVVDGATVNGSSVVQVNSPVLATQNGGIISGNPLVLNSGSGQGTIENPTGDLKLTSNLIFAGKGLSILAAGNITAAPTVTTINLSNTKGNGGSLLMVAGYNFGNPAASTVPVSGVFTITGPSTNGGSILLPGVAINTSSTNAVAGADNGGSVLAVSHGGTINSGIVNLKSINASANVKSGIGGFVDIIAQGGIQVGAIDSHGAIGDVVSLNASAPQLLGGTLSINNGIYQGPGRFVASAPTSNAGAGISAGAIISTGAVGRAGDVSLLADSQINVAGAITSTGFANLQVGANVFPAGANVNIQSTTATVSVTGAINTGALSANTAIGTTAGSAGKITIQAESNISTGSLLAAGAANTGKGAGGAGGVIEIATNAISTGGPADGDLFGNVKVTGFIDVHGGNANASATTSSASSNGGNSGVVLVNAGTFVVTASNLGISINDNPGLKGGTPGNTPGSVGSIINPNVTGVSITTYAVEQLPSNLDLTSSVLSIPQLPGGMFTVGLAAPVNGVAGSIAVDNLTANSNNYTAKTNGGGPLPGQFTTATGDFSTQSNYNSHNTANNINISITGPVAQQKNTPIVIIAAGANKGKRVNVTPSQAVNLFETERTGAAPLTLSGSGVATAGSATFDQLDINGTAFTAFKIPTNVSLNVTGNRPMLNLPSTVLMNGQLNFTTAGAIDMLNLGTGLLTINSGGTTPSPNAAINAAGSTLILSGTGATLTNNANLIAGTLVFARPSTAAFTYVAGTGSTTEAGSILLAPSVDVGMAMTFKANGAKAFSTDGTAAGPTIPFKFGNVQVPTLYSANATAYASNINTDRTATLSFGLSTLSGNVLTGLTADIGGVYNAAAPGGSFNAASITIKNLPSTVKVGLANQTVQTPILIDNSANIATDGAFSIAATDFVTLASGTINAGTTFAVSSTAQSTTISGATISAKSTATISGFNAVTIDTSANISALTKVSISATKASTSTLNIIGAVQVSAGSLIAPAPSATGNLAKNQVKTIGSLTLSAGGSVSFGDGSTLTSNGSDLRVIATTGDLTIGKNDNFIANGGNVFLFAKGNIIGSTGNFIHARSVGDTTNASTKAASTGGGIEIGAGLTTSTNLLAALALHQGHLPANPATGVLGNNTVVFNNNLGVIEAKFTGITPFNLTNNGGVPTLNLNSVGGSPLPGNNGGAQVFDGGLNGKTVKFDGGTFQTEALKPIAMVTSIEPEENNNSALPVNLQKADSGATDVSVGNYNAQLRLVTLEDGVATIATAEQPTLQQKFAGKLGAQIYAKPNTRFLHTSSGALHLTSGELFFDASDEVMVTTDSAEITFLKGALASVKSIQGCTYIRACSGLGTVTVRLNGKSIELNPGEEMLVTNHKPDESEIRPADGLGRRHSYTTAMGEKYVTISDFAIITMLSSSDSLASLVHSKVMSDKHLIDRVLKTAATVDVVLKYRGAYTAK